MTTGTDVWCKLGVTDALLHGGSKVRCDECATELRHVHRFAHDRTGRRIGLGCCCAARLVAGYDAKGEERAAINRGKRRMTFIDSKQWRTSEANNANVWRDVLIARKSYRVTVFFRDNQFCACVAVGNDDKRFTRKYAMREQAMSAAFEIVDAIKGNAR